MTWSTVIYRSRQFSIRWLPYFAAVFLTLFAVQSARGSEGTGFIETFDDIGYLDRWYIAHFDQNRESFRTSWRREAVALSIPAERHRGGGLVSLSLAPAEWGAPKPFVGAEIQRPGFRHFGTYEVFMQPAKGSGLVSSMFTYTGPYFGDPHDEIDLEFLGRDTTKIWINKFVDGEQMPGEWIDLGYDAASAPHLYRFEWHEDKIVWYAGETEIYRITSDTHEIPQTPSKVILNLWAGNERQQRWLGEVSPEISGEAKYYCVSYRPFDDDGPTCSDYISRK